MATVDINQKYEQLSELIGGMGRTLIAFSGGVDSTFLAKVAYAVLDRDAVAVTALSPTYPATELEEAKLYAAEIGIEHRLIETHELEKEEYAVNNPDRCFHCKKELFTEMQVIAEEEGFDTIVYGGIMDDLGDHRPGMEAAELLNARAPLVEAELQKHEIRQLSKELGLPTWDKPAGGGVWPRAYLTACASRWRSCTKSIKQNISCTDLVSEWCGCATTAILRVLKRRPKTCPGSSKMTSIHKLLRPSKRSASSTWLSTCRATAPGPSTKRSPPTLLCRCKRSDEPGACE